KPWIDSSPTPSISHSERGVPGFWFSQTMALPVHGAASAGGAVTVNMIVVSERINSPTHSRAENNEPALFVGRSPVFRHASITGRAMSFSPDIPRRPDCIRALLPPPSATDRVEAPGVKHEQSNSGPQRADGPLPKRDLRSLRQGRRQQYGGEFADHGPRPWRPTYDLGRGVFGGLSGGHPRRGTLKETFDGLVAPT